MQGAIAVIPREKRERGRFLRMLDEYRARSRGGFVTDLLVGACAFLLAQTHALFGVYPFAIAFLCSLRRHTLSALLGALLGGFLLAETGYLYIFIYIAIFLLRFAFSALAPGFFESGGLFDEHPLFRVLEACLVGCLMAAYELALFGIYDYTVLFALGAVLLPSFLTLAYAALMETGVTLGALLGKEKYALPPETRTGGAPFFLQIGGIVLLFSLVLSLRETTFFGVSLARCAIAVFTLLISRRFGGMRGCAAGLILALADEAIYIPSFGLLGLLSGLYTAIGMPCALAFAVLAGAGYAVYVGGLTGFLEVLPEISVTSLLLWPFLRAIPLAESDFFEKAAYPALPEPSVPTENAMARAYRTISTALDDVSKRERTLSPEALSLLCGQVQTALCRTCSHRAHCKEEIAVRTALALGEDAVEGCEAYGKMRETLARECAALSREHRLGGAKGTLSAEYALHAALLEEMDKRERDEGKEDSALSLSLRGRLEECGISATSVHVYGKRARRVVLSGVSVKGTENALGKLRSACIEVCGTSFGEIEMSRRGRRAEYILRSEKKYTARTAFATVPRAQGEASGDRTAFLGDGDGAVYAILSDGMGSGEGAAMASSLCVSVLSSLLGASVGEKTALAVAANILSAGNEECSVALDMLSLDLYTGHACFYKSGAAASFVQRGESLYRIRAKTIPMGVLREADYERIAIDLEEDDLLILLSDGVMQGNEDGAWLKELLKKEDGEDLDRLARRILSVARDRAGAEPDDMTVSLIRLDGRAVSVGAERSA